MVKRVLMIAFHLPPVQGSSGIQRTLGFARHLPRHGWEPVLLAPHRRAYESVGDGQDTEPARVHRSFALDSGRHLALRGVYPAALARPDRWISWWLSAVPTGLHLIRRYRPQAIWSTYPIATAHLIALTLQRMTGLPWIADMRDPMRDGDYPPDLNTRRQYTWIEQRAVARSAGVVCTTAGAQRLYRERYADTEARHFSLIENGYDEEDFAGLQVGDGQPAASRFADAPPASARPFLLLHSGLIYPSERDPTALFAALGDLLCCGAVGPESLRLRLRATGHDELLRQLIVQHGLAQIVELAPPLPYRAALAEMIAADGLLLLQAANCNAQVPAKLYEYLRARRPILALTDATGDTARTLRACGIASIAPLDARALIADALARFLVSARSGSAPMPAPALVAAQSRQARTAQLAGLLDLVTEET